MLPQRIGFCAAYPFCEEHREGFWKGGTHLEGEKKQLIASLAVSAEGQRGVKQKHVFHKEKSLQ